MQVLERDVLRMHTVIQVVQNLNHHSVKQLAQVHHLLATKLPQSAKQVSQDHPQQWLLQCSSAKHGSSAHTLSATFRLLAVTASRLVCPNLLQTLLSYRCRPATAMGAPSWTA